MSHHASLLPMPTIGDNEPHVSFSMMECRTCGDRSPWIRDGDDMYEWARTHAERWRNVPESITSTHGQFYRWAISRSTAKTYFV